MIQTYETERKVCLIMTKEPLNELRVSITPIKRSRDLVMDEEPVREDLNAYKNWLQELQQQESDTCSLWMHLVLDMYLI
jgi:succinate dehydrogenase/fumarate reductase-like Fe-S protein